MTDAPPPDPALSRAEQQAKRLRDNLRRRNAQRHARKADAKPAADADAQNPPPPTPAGLEAQPSDR